MRTLQKPPFTTSPPRTAAPSTTFHHHFRCTIEDTLSSPKIHHCTTTTTTQKPPTQTKHITTTTQNLHPNHHYITHITHGKHHHIHLLSPPMQNCQIRIEKVQRKPRSIQQQKRNENKIKTHNCWKRSRRRLKNEQKQPTKHAGPSENSNINAGANISDVKIKIDFT